MNGNFYLFKLITNNFSCSGIDKWHVQKNTPISQGPDPGPQVFLCLVHASYDDEKPLNEQCKLSVRRVFENRVSRVQLLPNIESNCRGALSRYCLDNTQLSEVNLKFFNL